MSDDYSGTMDSTATAAGIAPPAELVVSSVYVLPDPARSSDSLQLGAEARNEGAIESGPFKVRLTLDNGETREIPWPSLGPGQSHWEEWEHAALDAGQHTLTVELDINNEVQESNKYDNRAMHTFSVADATPAVEMNGYVSMHLDEPPTTVKDFSDEPEQVVADKGVSAAASVKADEEITKWMSDAQIEVINYWDNYRSGLDSFQTDILMASDEETKTHYADAAFKAVAEKLLDMSVEKLGDLLKEEYGGPWGQALGTLLAAGKAVKEEAERAEQAAEEDKLRKYILALRKGMDQQRGDMAHMVEALRDLLQKEFHRLADGASGNGKLTDEEQAQLSRFLPDLEQRVQAFKKSAPDSSFFQQQITAAYLQTTGVTRATTVLGQKLGEEESEKVAKEHPELVVEGGRPAGTLYLNVNVKMADEFPVMGNSDSTWTLALNIEDKKARQRLTQSLIDGLGANKPWQSDLPKTVNLSIYDSDGDDLAAKANIHFTSAAEIDQPKIEVQQAESFVQDPSALFNQVWKSHYVNQHVRSASGIVQSDT